MKADELLLHIGHPKTGTTTLQTIWQMNNVLLRQQGVLFPAIYPAQGQSTSIAYSMFGSRELDGHRQTWLQKDLLQMVAQGHSDWADLCKNVAHNPPRTILLTNEMLFRPMRPATIFDVNKQFDRIAQSSKLVVYLRSPHELFLSNTQEILKKLHLPARQSRTYCRDTLQPLIKHWDGTFLLEHFDRKSMHEGDITTDFMIRHLPFVDHKLMTRPAEAANTSLSAEAMSLLYDLTVDILPWRGNRAGFVYAITRFDQQIENPTKPKLRPSLAQTTINWRAPDLFWLRDELGFIFPNIDYDAIDADEIDDNVLRICRIEDICEVNLERKEALRRRVMRHFRTPKKLRRFFAKV